MLDVPKELVCFVAQLLTANRRALGTRRVNAGVELLVVGDLVLVWFRERRDVALAGREFGISQATAYRYLDEAIEVLAAQAPGQSEALAQVAADGWSHVVLDGKVIAADRLNTKTPARRER